MKPMHGQPAEEAGWALLAALYPKWSQDEERKRRHRELMERWAVEQEWRADWEESR